MKLNRVLALMLLILMTGCSQQGEAESNSPEAPEPTGATSSTLTLSGNEIPDFKFDPRFSCVNDQIFIQTMSHSPKFDLYLPATIQPGTYSLARYDASSDPVYRDNQAVVAFTGPFEPGSGRSRGRFYFIPVDGSVEIEQIPRAEGEFFTARLDATLSGSDEHTVTLQAVLNIEDTGFMTSACHSN